MSSLIEISFLAICMEKSNFSMAGADAFVTNDQDMIENNGYIPPPSPRKRWRKLEPVPVKSPTMGTLL